MTKLKKVLAIGTMVLTIGATSITAFAASKYNTPAEALAGLTGKTVESLRAERVETGKTYGTIASENGKLEAFKAEMLKIKKDSLAKKVEAGIMTQEKADEIIAAIEKNQANCDGTRPGKMGQKMGIGFSGMNGKGQGQGRGRGGCGLGLSQVE